MIFSFENRILQWVERNVLVIFIIIVSILALLMRIVGLDFISEDATQHLLHWYELMREGGGFLQLKNQIGDYNIPYQIFIACISYLDFPPMYMIKALSILFDYVLAAGSARLVYLVSGSHRRTKAVFVYAAILGSVNVLLNSSVWGQCDSIYVAFLIFSLGFLIEKKYVWAFLFWGLAFAMKLQAVLLAPVFMIYYFRNKCFSAFYLVLIPAVNFVLCIPAMIAGRTQGGVWKIYLYQMQRVPEMFYNYPNLYAVIGKESNKLHAAAIILCTLVIGSALVAFIIRKPNLYDKENLLMLALWGAWTFVMFMPSMHDRYAYICDILSIVLFFTCFRYLWIAVGCNLISLSVYSIYLFSWTIFDIRVLGVINLLLYIAYSSCFFRKILGIAMASCGKSTEELRGPGNIC